MTKGKAAVPKRGRQLSAAPARYASALGVITAIGLVASGYLAYTYLAGAELVCGGIGDCTTVHNSAYAKAFGVPIAYFGFVSYLAIAGLAVARYRRQGNESFLALLGIVAVSTAGFIFSAYLTVIELFVLAAICPWCVVSFIAIGGVAALALLELRQELRPSLR